MLTFDLLLILVIGVIFSGLFLASTRVKPGQIIVYRNCLTGKLSAKGPGLVLSFFPIMPYRSFDARTFVEAPNEMMAITKDGQQITLEVQQSYCIDALDPTGNNLKESGERNAVIAAAKIPMLWEENAYYAENQPTEEEKSEKLRSYLQKLVNSATESLLKEFMANLSLTQLMGEDAADEFQILCPICQSPVSGGLENCSKCGAGPIPTNIKRRISWAVSTGAKRYLSENFGITCDFRLLNIAFPKDLSQANLANIVAMTLREIIRKEKEIEKEVKQKDLEIKEMEAMALKKLRDTAGLSPSLGYITDVVKEVIKEILETKS